MGFDMARLTIVHYIVMHKRGDVLWTNRGHSFWVTMKASRLLRHSGVQRFIMHQGAHRAAGFWGGIVRLETELTFDPDKTKGGSTIGNL